MVGCSLQDAPGQRHDEGWTCLLQQHARTHALSCVLPWPCPVVVWWFARALFWHRAGWWEMAAAAGGGWPPARPVPADADCHLLLRPTLGRVWFRGGEAGGQAVALPMVLWWWLVEGGLGLKDEAALQFRSGHGTWKRNVSSRHPANRRRCNPPLVSPESRGSLVLIGFWFFFFGVDVCFLSDASIARAESGHWGRRKRAEWSVHDGLFPRHLTLLCPSFHLLLPNCGAKQVVKVLFSKPHISFCPPLSRASRCIVWSASAYDPPSTPPFAHLGHLSSLRGLRQSPASLPKRCWSRDAQKQKVVGRLSDPPTIPILPLEMAKPRFLARRPVHDMMSMDHGTHRASVTGLW